MERYSVNLLSKSGDLRKKFKELECFNVCMCTSLEEINGDVAIIDDVEIDINRLLERKDTIGVKHIFYRVSIENFRFSTKNILYSKGINMLQPYMTNELIVKTIYQKVSDSSKELVSNNIVTFFGADSKVGTTQLVSCLSNSIADKCRSSVCLVFLNGEQGTEYFNMKFSENIDSIKIKLVSKLATRDEIHRITHMIKDGLYVIEGTKSILYRKEYQPEHIAYLLNLLSDMFDLVVVDAGCNIDMAMPIAALTLSSNDTWSQLNKLIA